MCMHLCVCVCLYMLWSLPAVHSLAVWNWITWPPRMYLPCSSFTPFSPLLNADSREVFSLFHISLLLWIFIISTQSHCALSEKKHCLAFLQSNLSYDQDWAADHSCFFGLSNESSRVAAFILQEYKFISCHRCSLAAKFGSWFVPLLLVLTPLLFHIKYLLKYNLCPQ